MKTILSTILSAAFAGAAFAQVPSLINYQGRLTDANGDPVTGSKNFSISIFDAATGGNLLYTEDIGAVTLDDNGVYSFQFGGTGTSNTQVTETVASTDGTATTFQKVLANSPVVAGSVSVSDGTYTWSQSAGSSNEDDFGVAYSNSLRRVTVNYYAGVPAAGKEITATYRYGTSGITGALSSGAEHWMTVSVDSVVQGTRQRVLAVPYAQTAKLALEAVSLQKTEKEAILASWDVHNGQGNNIILNPVTNQGQGLILVRRIDPSIKKILRITTHVQIFNEPAGYAVLELMKVNKEGVETTAVEVRRNGTTGELIYSDPINLDWDQNDYYFRLNYSGYYDGDRGRFGNAKLKPVVIRYLE